MAPMQLSEAIRLGSMEKPQSTSGLLDRKGGVCALGAAMVSAGVPMCCGGDHYALLADRFPILYRKVEPPVHDEKPEDLLDVIWRLNDVHKWTREQIADWVETIERAQEAEIGSATQPAMEPAFTTGRSEARK